MDRGTVLRVWLPLVGGLYVIGFVFMGAPGPRNWTRWLGLMLMLVGLAGVVVSRYTLGSAFSVRARATALVTTGIYSLIRNPIYVSGVIFFVGLILIVRKPALGWILLVIVAMQIVRARREARVLEEKFGEAYREYRARTWF